MTTEYEEYEATKEYEATRWDIARLLTESERFPSGAEVVPDNAHEHAHALFLSVTWRVPGQDRDRLCVPIRFAIDGDVIALLHEIQDQAERKLFDEYFLRFVDDRMRDYDIKSGRSNTNMHGSTFDIIFDTDDMKPFHDALAKHLLA